MCELSLDKMGSIFADTNVYMLHMMYQAMGVCLYMQDWEGAMTYGEKIIHPYRLKYVYLSSSIRHSIYVCVIFFNVFVLQFSLPSLLSKCSIYVLETWSSLLGSGEDDTRSQSSQKGLCTIVAKFRYSVQQKFDEHTFLFYA